MRQNYREFALRESTVVVPGASPVSKLTSTSPSSPYRSNCTATSAASTRTKYGDHAAYRRLGTFLTGSLVRVSPSGLAS